MPTITSIEPRAITPKPPSQIHQGGPLAVDAPAATTATPTTVATDQARRRALTGSPGGQTMAAAPPSKSSQARVSVPR